MPSNLRNINSYLRDMLIDDPLKFNVLSQFKTGYSSSMQAGCKLACADTGMHLISSNDQYAPTAEHGET